MIDRVLGYSNDEKAIEDSSENARGQGNLKTVKQINHYSNKVVRPSQL